MASEHVRLLQCFDCRSVETMPDFQGPPEYDVVLHEIDDKHGGHEDDPLRSHNRAMHRVEKKYWDNPKLRRQVWEQMWSSTTGFKPEYYAAKDTLREDAMKCWGKHQRPELCGDWHSDSKRLGNPARAEREAVARDLGSRRTFEGLVEGGPRVFLCDFCPVASVVMMKRREAAGMYG